ncbi:hypothetical protein CC1G_02803 [Coprinopsis cinerea okayama7|uniref:DUF6533 domain-containing protein n=1 Tax=Coprinopsis cinerea (strain Okayama-7 / 130 / ATCC MYA-4618 / FGSC 9003) TaxID=240176 RepID=A8N034_COPC7|nr:hypothetical protein CC1G_02803 [Coprinopsis cinerea okayama7\|eukprot:XP_001828222.2 hypothetical protein CC1G_02803 [Coprinopsis cinerea okayama7\
MGADLLSDNGNVALIASRLRYVSYVETMALVYNICDHAHTFEWEAKYMWTKQRSAIQAAYFIARYLGVIDFPLMFIYNRASGLTPTQCNIIFDLAVSTALTGTACGEVLMLLRIYVLGGCKKAIRWYLLTFFTIIGFVIFPFFGLFLSSLVYAPSPLPSQISCYLQDANKFYLSMVYGAISLYQIIVMALCLNYGLSTFQYTRSQLIKIFYRDGTFYSMGFAALSIANLLIVIMGPPEFRFLLLMLQRSLKSTFSTRIILKMREMAHHDLGFQSRSLDPMDTTTGIEFGERRFNERQIDVITNGPSVRSAMSFGRGSRIVFHKDREPDTKKDVIELP